MALTAQQIQQIFGGNNMSPGTPNLGSVYGGVLPSMGGGNPALNAINAASPGAPSGPASWSAYDVGTGEALPGSAPQPSYTPPTFGMPRTTAAAPATGAPVNSVTGKMGFNPLFGKPAGSILSLLGGKLQLPQADGPGGGLMGLLQGIFGGPTAGAGVKSLPRVQRQTPSQSYADRNTMAGMSAIENSSLSAESKARAARSRSGGDAHGLTSNGNPGWWGS